MHTRNARPLTTRYRRAFLLGTSALLLTFAFVLGCGAADPQIEDEDEPLFGYVRALIDGEPWESTEHNAQINIRNDLPVFRLIAFSIIESLLPWSDSFVLAHPIEADLVLTTSNIHVRPVSHDLSDRYGMVYFELNGSDAIIGVHYAIEDDSNLLSIDSYDEETGVIEGAFEATLVVDFRHNLAVRPDTFRITEGEFRLLLEDHR